MTAFFQDSTLIADFKNETEVSILAYLTTTSAVNSPAVSIYLPRLKFGDGNVSDSGEGGQSISMPFQALSATATTATSTDGSEATTIASLIPKPPNTNPSAKGHSQNAVMRPVG
jgi:hypothetical protein